MAKPTADATESKTAAAPAAAKKPALLLVLDTTATHESGKRTHELIVEGMKKSFVFEAGVPQALAPAIAFKFLKHDAFWLVDDKGNRQDYRRRPRQPDELQAGEVLTLADNETVARYEELSMPALIQRALELPNSEKFSASNPSRSEMVKFIVEAKTKAKRENTKKDMAPNEFVPEAEFEEGDEAEAA